MCCVKSRTVFFLTQVGKDAVVVEADAMKSMDVIYKQLSKMSSFKSEPDISSYVHEYSTKQAEALFVSAINRYMHGCVTCLLSCAA